MILPENYVLEYPPFKVDDMGRPVRVNVTVKMELLAISDISEVGQTFTAQFNLFISWLDFRLELFNMKEDMNMNTLTADERESIWVPKLVFRWVAFSSSIGQKMHCSIAICLFQQHERKGVD